MFLWIIGKEELIIYHNQRGIFRGDPESKKAFHTLDDDACILDFTWPLAVDRDQAQPRVRCHHMP